MSKFIEAADLVNLNHNYCEMTDCMELFIKNAKAVIAKRYMGEAERSILMAEIGTVERNLRELQSLSRWRPKT